MSIKKSMLVRFLLSSVGGTKHARVNLERSLRLNCHAIRIETWPFLCMCYRAPIAYTTLRLLCRMSSTTPDMIRGSIALHGLSLGVQSRQSFVNGCCESIHSQDKLGFGYL